MPEINVEQIEYPYRCADKNAENIDWFANIKPIGQRSPDQRKNNQGYGPQPREDADLKAAEAQMIAVQIEIGQKDSQHAEIDKVLGTDDELYACPQSVSLVLYNRNGLCQHSVFVSMSKGELHPLRGEIKAEAYGTGFFSQP